MGESLNEVAGSTTDTKDVDKLIDQVAAEQNIQIGGQLAAAGTSSVKIPTAGTSQAKTVDEFQKRLEDLKQ